MMIRALTFVAAIALSIPTAFAADEPNSMDAATEAKLKAALAGSVRSADHKARDPYRHPLETLKFFGLKSNMTVLEVWPEGGWWTEFLAPVMADGRYIAADPPRGGEGGTALQNLAKKDPANFGKMEFAPFPAGDKPNPVKPGSVDMVLTFRNLHNWMGGSGGAKANIDAMYAALKPGGWLGIEEHRGSPSAEQDPKGASGYVREDYAIKLIESAGFKLVAKSEVNANPKDTKDYPKGVWTLPPNFAEKDKDRAKYAAIGESDRFTMLFQKPAQ